MNRRIVVTGASGFVGSCVVEALFLAGGYEPIPTARSPFGGGRVARFGCPLRPAHFDNPAEVGCLLDGADAVVHCAYGGDAGQERLTSALLDAAVAAKVGRFIHISTTEAYVAQEGTLDETADLQSEGGDYGAVKGRIDRLVTGYGDRFAGLAVLRPGIIYGPLSESWTIGPVNRLLNGWSPQPDRMQGTANLVHIGDVCRTIEMLLSRPAAGARVYNLVGPEVTTWGDYFSRVNRELGIGSPQKETSEAEKAQLGLVRMLMRTLPTGFRRRLVMSVMATQAGNRVIAGWRRLHLLEPMSAERTLFARKVLYSNARLAADGLAPRIRLDAGIRQSVNWARTVGLV